MCLSVRATPTLFGSKVPRHSGRSLELDLQIVHPRRSFRTQTTIKTGLGDYLGRPTFKGYISFWQADSPVLGLFSITHLLEYITCACTHVCTFAHRGGWCGGVKYHSLSTQLDATQHIVPHSFDATQLRGGWGGVVRVGGVVTCVQVAHSFDTTQKIVAHSFDATQHM